MLAMVLAVLEARCGLAFGDRDVYLNVAGGLRITEPAADLAAAAALVLSACSSTSDPSASSSTSGEAADFGEVSVQYSWIKNEEFAGEFYAYENGYYDEAGFSNVVGVAGPDTGVAKLLSGSVQFALTDAASVGAAVAEQDAPLKIIATTFQKNPFTILSLKDGANIATPQDLIGKKIGVQDSNASVFKALLAASQPFGDWSEKVIEPGKLLENLPEPQTFTGEELRRRQIAARA